MVNVKNPEREKCLTSLNVPGQRSMITKISHIHVFVTTTSKPRSYNYGHYNVDSVFLSIEAHYCTRKRLSVMWLMSITIRFWSSHYDMSERNVVINDRCLGAVNDLKSFPCNALQEESAKCKITFITVGFCLWFCRLWQDPCEKFGDHWPLLGNIESR